MLLELPRVSSNTIPRQLSSPPTKQTNTQGTPIGNLEDISFRAIRILKGVNLILAEDTRHTRKLLDHFDIRTPTLSCHEHNEQQRQQLVVQRLQQGEVSRGGSGRWCVASTQQAHLTTRRKCKD